MLIDGDDILGDGVNIAARLEGICEPGGVLISGTAYEHVRGRIEAELGRLDEAQSAVRAGLALNPAFSISRTDALWRAMSDDRTYLAQLEPILEGMRKAVVPE